MKLETFVINVVTIAAGIIAGLGLYEIFNFGHF